MIMRFLNKIGFLTIAAIAIVALSSLKYKNTVTDRTIEFKVADAYGEILYQNIFTDKGEFIKGLKKKGKIPQFISSVEFNIKNGNDSLIHCARFIGDLDSLDGASVLTEDASFIGHKIEFLVKDSLGNLLESLRLVAENKSKNCNFLTEGAADSASLIELVLRDKKGDVAYTLTTDENTQLKQSIMVDTKEPLLGHRFQFNVKNLNDSIVYLARYFGDNKYIKDTILVDGKESFTIEGKEAIECGIYMIVREKRNNYFEFLVNDQGFVVNSDTADFINGTEFLGSEDNEKLYEYFRYTNKKGKELQDSTISQEDKFNIHNEIGAYKKEFIKKYPANPMSVVFSIQGEVEVPKELKDLKGDEGDKARYYYYIDHYWDKVDFNSSCLLRTPVFHGYLQRYFDKWVPQHYDSIPKYADKVVSLAKVNPEVFKYVVNYLTFKWESGKEKRMCWDKVFHHMARSYYLTEPTTQTPWVEEGQMAKIRTRAQDLDYCLCGELAVKPQMMYQGSKYGAPGMDDTLMNRIDLHAVPADYIIMWFWDSDCGHCKKQTPKLWDVYQKYKSQGKSVEVYAVNIEQETPSYLEYLREQKYSWINVQDTAHLTKFRDYYDIYSTPVAFILDKERKIIGKRIDPPAIDNFLEQLFRIEEEKKNKKI